MNLSIELPYSLLLLEDGGMEQAAICWTMFFAYSSNDMWERGLGKKSLWA